MNVSSAFSQFMVGGQILDGKPRQWQYERVMHVDYYYSELILVSSEGHGKSKSDPGIAFRIRAILCVS